MKPIIFVPGIEATALANANTFDFDIVWNAYDTTGTALFTKIAGQYIEEKLQRDPLFDARLESLIERNHIARLPYEKTFQNLSSKMKEKKDPGPCYLFGYDWRMSNDVNGRRLLAFTNYIKAKLGASNVPFEGFRFITHSMGGLVFSCYLRHLNGNYADIDRALLCAPPFQGSPYALVHLIKGAGGPKSLLNSIFGRNEDIRKVVRTYPSLFELLPYYPKALVFEKTTNEVDLLVMANWQSNVYDDDPTLFEDRLVALRQFRQAQLFNLEQLPADVRTRLLILAGTEDKTLTQLQVKPVHNQLNNFVMLDDKYKMASGDGTVPQPSSTIYKEAVKTLVLPKRNIFHELADAVDYHGLFLRDSRVQNIVFRFILENRRVANVQDGTLTALAPDQANWFKSAGDGVDNISPF